jgi:tetratricopeptide (TPR) repeat protein
VQLLGPAERQLFVRLGVFESGVPLTAIEDVCAEPGVDVVDALAHLVDQSLVKRLSTGDEPRFVLLELVRQRARELLVDERQLMRSRHADYVVRTLDDIEERRWNELSSSWIDRVTDMLAEVRAAHAWAVESGATELAARLTAGLGAFWHRDGHHAEGLVWVSDALGHLDQFDERLQARVHLAAAFLEWPRDLARALQHWDRAVDAFRRLGDDRYLSYALSLSAGSFIGNFEEYEEGLRRCREGIALARQVGERPLIAQALNVLGELARVRGDDDLALTAYEEGRDLAIAAGDAAHLTVFIANLSYLADHRGDFQEAREANCEALVMCRALGRRMMAAWTLSELAGPEVGLGRPERGALFVGAADAALRALGVGRHPGDRSEHDRVVASLDGALGEQRSRALQARGARMSLDEAIDLALTEDEPVGL